MNEQEIKAQLKQELKEEMKQEKKKKRKIKLIILFIILAILISWWGLAVYNSQKLKKEHEIKIISKEEFSQYITEIPITTENWKNYFDYEYKKVENKDAFGEIISTKYEPHLKLKDNMYGYVVLQIEINNNLYSDYEYKTTLNIRSNDTTLPMADFRLKSNATITMNDIICTKAKGSLYTLNLPEDIWQVEETDGKKYFNVATENGYTTCWEDTYINQLSDNEYLKYRQSIK